MKKNEKIIAIVFSVMLILTLLPIVSAAAISATWNPTTVGNYSNLSTSFSFNCTVSAHKATNVTVYANSTAGVMNPLQSFANTTASQTAWTGTVSIQAADDGSNQNLTCKAQNATATGYSNEKTASRIRLDSTNPTCSISVAHTNIAYKTLQSVTWAGADATAIRLTSVDVNGPGAQTTIQSTTASRTLDMGSNATKYVGSWTANMTTTDWSGNSCTASTTFKSYLPSGDDEEVAAQADQTTQNNKMIWLVIIGIVLYFVFKKK